MMPFQKLLKFIENRSGATVVEYCLIAGLIALAIVGGVSSLGATTNASFVQVNAGVWGP